MFPFPISPFLFTFPHFPSLSLAFSLRFPHSSSKLPIHIHRTVFICSLIGIFSAGDLKNALLVDSTLSIILAAVNVTGLSLFLLIFFLALALKQRWPVTQTDVRRIVFRDIDMLSTMNEAKKVLEESIDCPGEFISRFEVKSIVESLDRLRKEARSSGHLLEWTLHDMTEDMALIYENTQSQSVLPNEVLEVSLACAT